jgi:hypothetical protein
MMRRILILCLLAGFAAPLAAAGEEWIWTIPSNMTLEATGPSGRVVTFTVTARWNGNNATVTCAPASGSTFPIARTKVRCEARFGSHTDEKDFDITIRDTTPPAITVPGDITLHTNDPSGAVVGFNVSATDLVDGNRPVSCAPASGTRFSIGTRRVSCTSSDTRENVGTAGFDVTITFHPIAVPANMTVEATSFAGAVVTYAVSGQDRQARPIAVSCSPASGSTFPLGPTTVTCTATANGEPSTERFIITVADRTPPVITVPRTKVVRTTLLRGVVVRFGVSASDLVDGVVAAKCSPSSGARFRRGETTVTCTSADRRGNASSASFKVIVARARTVKSASLFAPRAGARVSRPPVLRWRAVPKARFYNAQVYRNGRKILSLWPSRASLKMTRSWQFGGHTFRLKPGVYTWYVWPGFGTLATPRFGKLLGQSSFRVV